MPSPEAAELLAVLAEYPQGASLPRLAKRLGLRASSLMRLLAPLGGESLGGVPGPGWIAMHEHQGGWTVRLTEAGRQALD